MAGLAPAVAADIDGDGVDEVFLGAPDWEISHETDEGESELLGRGRAWIFPAAQLVGPVDVADAWVTFDNDGALDSDYDHDGFGRGVLSLGDLDGDGTDDLVVSGSGFDRPGSASEGVVTLWLGDDLREGGTRVPADASGMAWGLQRGDSVGRDIAWVGDVDGDGVSEVLVGADDVESLDGTAMTAGAAYLLSGTTLLDGDADMDDALASFHGVREDDLLGAIVIGPGDVDGDGVPDIAIGAELSRYDSGEQDSSGGVYIWWGAGVAAGGTYERTSADASVVGEGALNFADRPGVAGDWDGDGRADIWVEGGFATSDVSWPEQVALFTGEALAEGGEHLFYSPHTAALASDAVPRTRRGTSEGDLDGDGCPDLVVTAYVPFTDDEGETDDYWALFFMLGG